VKGQFLIEYRGDLVENGVEENQFDDETFVYFFKHKKYSWYSFLICEFFLLRALRMISTDYLCQACEAG